MDQNHYREKARECLCVAEHARSSERLELLNIAQEFLRLATYKAAFDAAGSRSSRQARMLSDACSRPVLQARDERCPIVRKAVR